MCMCVCGGGGGGWISSFIAVVFSEVSQEYSFPCHTRVANYIRSENYYHCHKSRQKVMSYEITEKSNLNDNYSF